MGHGEGDGFRHRRMLEQRLVDFARGDVLAAAIDHLSRAAGQIKVTFVVEKALVAGLEPIADEGGGRRRRVAVIAGHDAAAAHGDVAGLAGRQRVAAVVQDRDVEADRNADGAGLALARRQRIAGNRRGSGFRHAVEFDDRGAKRPFQLGEHKRRQRRRGRADQAQPDAGDLIRIEPRLGENRLMHGRHRGVPGRRKLAQPAEEAIDVAARRANHAAAGGERCHHGGDQTVTMKQRQHVQAAIGFAQLERRDGAEGRGADIGVRKRHDLRPRCGAGREQQQRGGSGPDRIGRRLARRCARKREQAGGLACRRQVEYRQAARLRDAARRSIRRRPARSTREALSRQNIGPVPRPNRQG